MTVMAWMILMAWTTLNLPRSELTIMVNVKSEVGAPMGSLEEAPLVHTLFYV